MNYTKPPVVSKKSVNRAGQVLCSTNPGTKEYKAALTIANEWRLAHIYPINTFQARLRKMVKKYPEALVAQRLKRMPTIIDKLDRHPNMQLSTMQDIGGVRAIVETLDAVYEIANQYQTSSRFTHELKDKKDYITEPKQDGYRGIHLIYRYNNTLARGARAQMYKGLMVEVQLRTKEQHTWATAVETMSVILDQPFKTRGGDKDWHAFFSLMSSAIALVEGTSVLQAHKDLTAVEIYRQIAKVAGKLHVLDRLRGYNVAASIIQQSDPNNFYNIIILDTKDKTVRIVGYAKKDYEKAVQAYSVYEASAEGEKDVVLVSAGKLRSLRLAYPNYFLDINKFVTRVQVIVEEIKQS